MSLRRDIRRFGFSVALCQVGFGFEALEAPWRSGL